MWITGPTLFQCKDAEIAQRRTNTKIYSRQDAKLAKYNSFGALCAFARDIPSFGCGSAALGTWDAYSFTVNPEQLYFSRRCLRDSRREASALPRQIPSAALETPACRSH